MGPENARSDHETQQEGGIMSWFMERREGGREGVCVCLSVCVQINGRLDIMYEWI